VSIQINLKIENQFDKTPLFKRER